jgi:hypothetical protein
MNKAYKLTMLAGVLLLTACASKLQDRATNAAATPLSDLNIVKAEIPEILLEAAKAPYLPPVDQSCPALLSELGKLNDALGADLDTPASDDSPSLIDRGTDMGENAAIGALQRTAEGLIPFRSWVRKLSGAERYSRKVAASITAGSIRRAFVKGVAASHGCAWNPPPPVPKPAQALTASASASAPTEASSKVRSASPPAPTASAASAASAAMVATAAPSGQVPAPGPVSRTPPPSAGN